MHPLLRSALALTAVLACADASAAVRRNCVTSLEAQPRPAPSSVGTPRKPCPVAVGFQQPTPVPRDAIVQTTATAAGRARV